MRSLHLQARDRREFIGPQYANKRQSGVIVKSMVKLYHGPKGLGTEKEKR
jgi:hypothetical protein